LSAHPGIDDMEESERLPRIRVAAAVVRDGRLLLVRHRKGRDYYLLPGGGVGWGESLADALSREVKEETGLQVRAGSLLCVSETIFPDASRHIVNIVFEGTEKGGELAPAIDARVVSAEFVDLSEIDRIELLPPLGDFLARACRPGYEGGCVYLGRLWKEMG
jgi:8-oxo-dGTP diphosphatase